MKNTNKLIIGLIIFILLIVGSIFLWNKSVPQMKKEITTPQISKEFEVYSSPERKKAFTKFFAENPDKRGLALLETKEYQAYRDALFLELIIDPKNTEIINEIDNLIIITEKYAGATGFGDIINTTNKVIDSYIVNNVEKMKKDSAFEDKFDREIIINQLVLMKTYLNPYNEDLNDLFWSVQKHYCGIIEEKLKKHGYTLTLDCIEQVKKYDKIVTKALLEQNSVREAHFYPLLSAIEEAGKVKAITHVDDLRKIPAYQKIVFEYIPEHMNGLYAGILEERPSLRMYHNELNNLTRMIEEVTGIGYVKSDDLTLDDEEDHYDIWFDLEEISVDTTYERMEKLEDYFVWADKNIMDPFRTYIKNNPEVKDNPEQLNKLLYDPRKGIMFRIFLMFYEAEGYEEGLGTLRKTMAMMDVLHEKQVEYYKEVLTLIEKEDPKDFDNIRDFYKIQSEEGFMEDIRTEYYDLREKYSLGNYLVNEFIVGYFMEKTENDFRTEVLDISVNREEPLNDFAHLRMKLLSLVFMENEKYRRERILAQLFNDDELQMYFDFSFFFIDPEKEWDGTFIEASEG